MKRLFLLLLLPTQLWSATSVRYRLSEQDFSPYNIRELIFRYGLRYNVYGNTLLHEAAACGNKTAVEHFLTKGASLTKKSRHHDMTALHHAVYGGDHAGTVQFLLQKDPSIINATTALGRTALSLAVQRNRHKCVALLLEADANISITDKHSKTAHHYATTHTIRRLLDQASPTGSNEPADMYMQ